MIYRAGVIGHTKRGDYGHGLDVVWRDLPETELVAVADANPEGLQTAGDRLGVPESRRYADYREMLQRERPDLVSVAPRWVGEHREMVLAAVEAGVRGIFCEKPFAQSLRDADEMIAAADAAGVKIAVAHQNRVHPLVCEMKRLLDEEFIGTAREIHGFGKQDSRGGGLDLIVLGTHIFDMMRLFGGDPRWVEACVLADGRDATLRDAKPGAEEVGPILGDHLRAVYGMPNGVLGTFVSRREGNAFGNRSMGVRVEGTAGILAYHGGRLTHYPHPCWTPNPAPEAWRVLGGPIGLESLNAVLVRDLIDAIERDRAPIADADGARWALEMILGVYAAHLRGRTPLPAADREHPLRDRA